MLIKYSVKYNTQRLGNVQYIWLEQLNISAKYGTFSNKNVSFIGQNL